VQEGQSRPLRIGLDATCTCHGYRAIRRYAVNLIRQLVKQSQQHQYRLLRVNPRSQWILSDVRDPSLVLCDTRIPARILYPLWHRLAIPSVETFTGALDVFHATDMELPTTSRRVPMIWTVHGLNYVARPDLMQEGYVEKATGWLELAVRRCAHFIAVSQHTAHMLQERYPQVAGRVTAIPLGVGEEFKPEGPASDLVDRPYILFVGAVAAVKNVGTLVQAYGVLRDRTKVPHRLVLVGAVDKAYWKRIMPARYVDDVVLLGHLDQDASGLPKLYRGADAFAFPSYSEGWTSPPLEAMASGVPVVTSNASSLPETVGDGALMVDPDDVDALASTLDRLIHDQGLRQSMVEKGLRHAAAFTWERMAQATTQVYEQVASAR
jgi:glycosyltransferase involved in cell wall biosynthesis